MTVDRNSPQQRAQQIREAADKAAREQDAGLVRPESVRFDDDLSLVEAYHSMRRHCPDVRISGKRIKLSGKFVALDTVRAMRAIRNPVATEIKRVADAMVAR